MPAGIKRDAKWNCHVHLVGARGLALEPIRDPRGVSTPAPFEQSRPFATAVVRRAAGHVNPPFERATLPTDSPTSIVKDRLTGLSDNMRVAALVQLDRHPTAIDHQVSGRGLVDTHREGAPVLERRQRGPASGGCRLSARSPPHPTDALAR